jgi:hypothetical protein
VIEGDTGGAPVPPFDYLAIKRLFGGIVIANNGFDKERANEAIWKARADLVAFGKPFIGNPDLVTRLYLDAPLSPLHRETLYGGAEQGYTDYPAFARGRAARLLRRRGPRLGLMGGRNPPLSSPGLTGRSIPLACQRGERSQHGYPDQVRA